MGVPWLPDRCDHGFRLPEKRQSSRKGNPVSLADDGCQIWLVKPENSKGSAVIVDAALLEPFSGFGEDGFDRVDGCYNVCGFTDNQGRNTTGIRKILIPER